VIIVERWRVYAPRSEQSNLLTEPDLLTPRAGSLHSDPFIVTTAPVAGAKPYALPSDGRTSRFDFRTRAIDVGERTMEVGDVRLGDGDAARWMTQFLGDDRGRNRLIGCKVDHSLSYDGGATFSVTLTGRILDVDNPKTVILRSRVRSMAAELRLPIFVGRPATTATNAVPAQYWPLGLSAPYGPIPQGDPVPLEFTSTNARFGVYDFDALAQANNLIVDALRAVVPCELRSSDSQFTTAEPTDVRLRVRFTTGASAGQTKEYLIRGIGYRLNEPKGQIAKARSGNGNDEIVQDVWIAPVPTTDPFFAALPANGVRGECRIVAPNRPPSSQTPLRINDIHPVLLFEELCRGDYGYLDAGGLPIRQVRTDASSFTALKADPSFGLARPLIEADDVLDAWSERELFQVFGFAARELPDGSIGVFDARVPATTAGLPTITDADLQIGPSGWKQSREGSITQLRVTTFFERLYPAEALADLGDQRTTVDLISATPRQNVYATQFRPDMGNEVLTINATALRFMVTDAAGNRLKRDVVAGIERRLVAEFAGPLGSAPMETTLTCARTANTIPRLAGDFAICDISTLPNPASNLRGGPRLVRILEATDDAERPLRTLRCLDAGPTTAALSPTIGTVTLASDDLTGAILVPVTLNANSDPVALETAATETTATSAPDGAWVQQPLVTATGTVRVSGLPSNRKIWTRIRAQPTATTLARVPSAWVVPTPAFITTDTLPRPGVLSAGSITDRSAVLSWSNTSASLPIGVAVYDAAFGPALSIEPQVVLDPGSTQFVAAINPAVVNFAYIAYLDRTGAEGESRSVSITPGATAPAAPAIPSFVVG
jgi:hypothetical protein